MKYQMMEVGFKTNLKFGELHIAGDDEFGFRPYQLLVSSIVGCSGGVLRTILQKKRIEIEDMKVTTDVIRNDKNANIIEKIHIHYEMKGQNLDEKKIEHAIEIAKRNCPMVQAVKNNIEITETFSI